MANDVLELVDMMTTVVTEAWGIPFLSERCFVDRNVLLNLLEEIKSQLPAELAESKRLVASRAEYIANARKEAEAISKAAREEAKKLVENDQITRDAKARAVEILTTADAKAKELRGAANDYIDDALRRTEASLEQALAEVKQSRANFRNASGGNN